MIIRSKSFRDWMQANFDKDDLRDIARYGCGNGFPGLTYYTDTVKLYDRFEDEIWERAYEYAEGMDYTSILDMLANANGADVATGTQFKNLMVWLVAEEIARELTDN